MASVELGIKYIANNLQLLKAARRAAEELKKNATELAFYPSADWTKLVWDLKALDICADKAYLRLEERGIYAELSDGRYIVFYLSPMTGAEDLKALLCAARELAADKTLAGTYKARPLFFGGERACGYLKATECARELVPLAFAKGRACAADAGLTPPCIPVICAGEVITEGAIYALLNAKSTFGLTDNRVWVVKE